MTSTIHIPAHERGTIRVFAVNRPAAEVGAALRLRPRADVVRDLLAAPHLDSASAELFPVSDLAGVGLTRYLADGYSVEETRLHADRHRLDALEGYVLLLFSDSFGGAAATLDPGPEVTLIGTYTEFQPSLNAPPLTAESAQPYTGTPGLAPPTPVPGRAGSAMAIVGVIVAACLLIWWLLT